jgi:hypothetical protein
LRWEFIAELGDEAYVQALYVGVLGREPSPDDLAFRVRELANGRSREQLFRRILDSDEHQAAQLQRVAQLLKR